MNYLFIISTVLTVAVAQEASLSCEYYLTDVYTCYLTFNNPSGLNNFTEIEGIHLTGYTDADVQNVYSGGVSPILPSIICDTFPNLLQINLYGIGLTEIGDSAFSGCSLVTELYFYSNNIASISTNAFITLHDIHYINLGLNALTTLPENVFASQQSLEVLYMYSNPFELIPGGLFRPLENLRTVNLGNTSITTINNQWFANNTRLDDLSLYGNNLVLSADDFIGLEGLIFLNLGENGITEIPSGTFAPLQRLQGLYLHDNSFGELQADSFLDLGSLQALNLDFNPIEVIHDGAFRGLANVFILEISYCRLRQLHSNSFEGLDSLRSIYLNFNDIEELPDGVFAPLLNIINIGLWNNRLKTLRRSQFGTLTSFETLDLDGNIVNGVDQAFIDDAVNIDTLYFYDNLCANEYFGFFQMFRAEYMRMLERCFSNFIYIVETVTVGDGEFSFFQGKNPGIVFRVNANNEVQIALTAFNFIWSPVIEIFIGTANNTRSEIRVNEETNVVTVPTPNILIRDQWNDFRVSWQNRVILVFSGNSSFPFMTYTMQDFFPVNFYALRSLETTALWTVQPMEG